jgi:hypothetical protein
MWEWEEKKKFSLVDNFDDKAKLPPITASADKRSWLPHKWEADDTLTQQLSTILPSRCPQLSSFPFSLLRKYQNLLSQWQLPQF